jgi:hypothetical protein
MEVKDVVSASLFVLCFFGPPLFLFGALAIGAIQWWRMSERERQTYRHLAELSRESGMTSEWARILRTGY